MKEHIKIPALAENLGMVTSFVAGLLEKADCPMKQQMQIEVAVEEIFINIANYAYAPLTGSAEIDFLCENGVAEITFIDNGVSYDPLAKADPDITLSARERPIGGLEILMVKKTMDDVLYRSENDCNILTIRKYIK